MGDDAEMDMGLGLEEIVGSEALGKLDARWDEVVKRQAKGLRMPQEDMTEALPTAGLSDWGILAKLAAEAEVGAIRDPSSSAKGGKRSIIKREPWLKLRKDCSKAIAEAISTALKAARESAGSGIGALERRKHLARSFAFLSKWRAWMLANSKGERKVSMKEHFASRSAYCCAMINLASASMSLHEIAKTNIERAEGNMPDSALLAPFILGIADSQDCESMFRALRALLGSLSIMPAFAARDFNDRLRIVTLRAKWLGAFRSRSTDAGAHQKLEASFTLRE